MFLFGCFCVSVFLCVCACERSSTVCGATLARRAEWKHATQSHVNCPGQWSYHGAAKHNCAPRYRYSGVQSNIFRRWTPRFLTKNQICVPFLFWVIDTTFLMKGCATTNQICVSPVLGDRHHVCDKRVVRRQISNLRFATVLGDQHHVCDESVVQRQKMNPIIFQGKPCHKSYHERTRIS